MNLFFFKCMHATDFIIIIAWLQCHFFSFSGKRKASLTMKHHYNVISMKSEFYSVLIPVERLLDFEWYCIDEISMVHPFLCTTRAIVVPQHNWRTREKSMVGKVKSTKCRKVVPNLRSNQCMCFHVCFTMDTMEATES